MTITCRTFTLVLLAAALLPHASRAQGNDTTLTVYNAQHAGLQRIQAVVE